MFFTCKNYVGLSCVDGSCPIANEDDYFELHIPMDKDCKQCYMNKGCEDCALLDTKYCDKQVISESGDK